MVSKCLRILRISLVLLPTTPMQGLGIRHTLLAQGTGIRTRIPMVALTLLHLVETTVGLLGG